MFLRLADDQVSEVLQRIDSIALSGWKDVRSMYLFRISDSRPDEAGSTVKAHLRELGREWPDLGAIQHARTWKGGWTNLVAAYEAHTEKGASVRLFQCHTLLGVWEYNGAGDRYFDCQGSIDSWLLEVAGDLTWSEDEQFTHRLRGIMERIGHYITEANERKKQSASAAQEAEKARRERDLLDRL